MTKKKKGGGKKGKGDWDRVPIGEEFLGAKEMENLISLEILTDYQLVRKGDGLTEIVKGDDDDDKGGKKGKKRKVVDLEEDQEDFNEVDDDEIESGDDHDDHDDEEVPVLIPAVSPSKKVKQNKKGKKRIVEKVKDSDNKEEDEEEELGSEMEVVEEQKKEKVKNKKKEQKKKKANPPPNKKSLREAKEEEKDEIEAGVSMEEWQKAGVPHPVLKALKEAKFYQPTAIQALTLPASILGKKDVVGAAETGSGKTLAFSIPIIHGILHLREQEEQRKNDSSDDEEEEEEQSSLKALILTPTRELAVQIKKHFDIAAKFTKIQSVVIVGGLATQKQERLLSKKPEVVIATPGRLWELVNQGEPHLSGLNKIRFLAVDETDRMVERGHFEELQSILSLVNSEEERKTLRQNFVFSATLAFTHDPPKRLQNKKMKKHTPPKKLSGKEKLSQIMELVGVRPNPKIVDITSSKGTCETLQEMQINCPSNKKDYYMYYFLIKHPGRTIVFCNSINTVRRLTNLFFLLQCGQVLPLHAEMHQKQRLRNLEKFAAEEKSVLIATDVAARGLDISDIEHVVHYEIPKTAESYIHRSGRTARASKGGVAVVLVEPGEIGRLKNIFRSLNRDQDKMLPLFAIDGTVFRHLKARVDEADKVEKFEHTVRKKLADLNWMDKAKKDMDMVISSEEEGDSDDDGGDGETRQRRNLLQAKKKLEGYKKTLDNLLSDNSFMQRLKIQESYEANK